MHRKHTLTRTRSILSVASSNNFMNDYETANVSFIGDIEIARIKFYPPCLNAANTLFEIRAN